MKIIRETNKNNKQKTLFKFIIQIMLFFICLCSSFIYINLSSNNVKVQVQAAGKQSIFLEFEPQEFTYDGTQKEFVITGTLLTGFNIEYYVNKSYTTTAPSQAGTYNVRITRPEDNYYYSYNSVITSGLVIKKASFDLEDLTVSDVKVVYDGEVHYPEFNMELPVGVDGTKLNVTYDHDIKNVISGKTLVTVKITTDSPNYNNPNLSLSAYVEITPYPVEITWCEDDFSFNGQNQKSSLWATYVDAFGKVQNLKITCNESEFKNYQEQGYDMIASFFDKELNHSLPTVYTKKYHIKKISYDMSGVSFKPQIYVYDGKAHNLEVDGTLPTGLDNEQVKVSYVYTGNKIDATGSKVLVTASFTGTNNYEEIASMDSYFIINPLLVDVYWSEDKFTFNNMDQSNQVKAWWFDVNNKKHYFVTDLTNFINYQEDGYVVSVSFDSSSSANYAVSPLNKKTYHIQKSTYTMNMVTFTDGSYEYDGKPHSLEISGILPKGLDGSTVTVSYQGQATNVSEGQVKVTAIFESGSLNYKAPDSMEAWVSITPKAVDVYWTANDFVYTGLNQKASIEAWWFDINNEKHFASVYMDDFINCNPAVYFAQAILGTTDEELNYHLQRNTSASFNMKQASYDMSSVSFENQEIEYDGASHSIEIKGELPIGADNIQVKASYQGQACNVIDGKTLIRVTYSTESLNYLVPKDQVAYLTIVPKTVTPIFVKQDLVYDGTNQINKFDTYYYDVNNNKIPLAVKVKSNTPLILKDAGTYVLETAFQNSDSNYTLGDNSTYECTIQKIDYDISNITLNDQSFVYDGKLHNLQIEGSLPIGLDNIRLDVVYSDGLTQPGSKQVTATFVNNSSNYNTPEPLTAWIYVLSTSLNSQNYSIMLTSPSGFLYGSSISIVSKNSLNHTPKGLVNRFEKLTTVYELKVLDQNGKELTLSELTKENELTVKIILPSNVLYSKYKIAKVDDEGNYQILTESKVPSTSNYHMLNGYFETNIDELTYFVFICEEECIIHYFFGMALVLFIVFVIIYYFGLKYKRFDAISIIAFVIYGIILGVLCIFSHCLVCWIMLAVDILFMILAFFLFLVGKRIRFYVENY